MFRFGTTVLAVAVSALIFANGTTAQKPVPAGVRMTFVEGTVSFVAPPGFTALTSAELAKRFPHQGGVANAVGDSTRRSIITYELQEGNVPSTNLEEGRKAFTQSVNQDFQNPKWITNEIRRIGTREWVVQEFTESVSPTPMRQILMFSVHRQRVLIFNFSAPITDFPKVEPQFRATMASVVVKS